VILLLEFYHFRTAFPFADDDARRLSAPDHMRVQHSPQRLVASSTDLLWVDEDFLSVATGASVRTVRGHNRLICRGLLEWYSPWL
jgi:hypothetical protein